MSESDDHARKEFADAVNLPAKEIEDWLQSDRSEQVGRSTNGGASKVMIRRCDEVLSCR